VTTEAAAVASEQPATAAAMIDRFRLDGKVVVVTGASSGLGVAFAQACAQMGAHVVVAARRAHLLDSTVAAVHACGREGVAVAADVTVAEDCRRVVATATERFGRVDVLINNAGVEDHVPASRLPVAEFEKVVALNLTACFAMAQAAAPAMRAGSSIVNVASVLARTTLEAPTTAYAASKAGLLGLTRSLARQWSGRKGIRVNAVLPGFFPSEMTAELPGGLIDHRLVLGRLGDPDELAAAVVFLASDASSYMTGSELVVDGGLLLT
jgi:NAD(P)-dependent dehydrogenase (short-subunit alcohol dehydrogenase family)